MKWKIYYSLILLVFSVTCLSAQVDSLLVVSDSLILIHAKENSLMMQALLDSLDMQEKQVDYLAYLKLNEKVEQYKTESRKTFTRDKNKRLYWSIQGHLFGLSSDNYFIKRDSFTEIPSLYPTSLKLQNYNRFYTENVSGDYYTLTKEHYLLPVTAIEVVASTGDYDLGTGYFTLKKNKFLDKYNLDFRMNFVKGDFYYGSELASNSSSSLIIPLKKSQLNISFNSVSYEGPFHRLSPAFQLNTTIFEETSQAMSILWDNSILDFGLKYSKETFKRITPTTLEREYFQVLLNREFSLPQWQGKISYEYFLHNEDFYNQEFNSLSSDIDQLLDFELASDYDKFNLSNRLVVTYPYQLLTNSAITYNLTNSWQVGAFTNNRKTLKKDNLFTDYVYSSDTAIAESPLYLNEKNYTGFDLGYANSDLNLAAKVGYASIESQLFDSEFNHDYIAFKSQVSGNYSHTFGKYQLNLATLMKFYIETLGRDIPYNPKASMTNSLDLSRDIDHDNYIKAGVAHHYFDAYIAFEDKEEVPYPEASLLDLYLGFQITKQFEVYAYWKNILDYQVITGHETMPQSITVLISWNFLN